MYAGLRDRLRAIENQPRKSTDPNGLTNIMAAVERELQGTGRTVEDIIIEAIDAIEATAARRRMEGRYDT